MGRHRTIPQGPPLGAAVVIDFLDVPRPSQSSEIRTSRIQCDSEGCGAVILVPNDIDEAQSAAIARHAGWQAQLGAHRFYHHCARCMPVKR